MTMYSLVFLAGLCLRPFAAELSTEAACLAEGCPAKAASGSSMLQKKNSAEPAGELGAVEEAFAREAAEDRRWFCYLPKWWVKRVIKKTEKKIAGVPGAIKKCVA